MPGSGQNRGKNRRFRTFRLAFLSQKRKEAGVSFGVPGKGKSKHDKKESCKEFLVRESVISKENIKKLDKRLKLTIIVNQGDGRRAYG